MRIHFDFEFGFRDIVQWINEQVCKHKGHQWRKYKDDFWGMSSFANLILGQVTHTCKRCGEVKRAKPEKSTKPLKIKRYSRLSSKSKKTK